MIEFLLSILAAAVALVKFTISSKLLKIFPPPVRPIVKISEGKLRGVTATLPNGSAYHYFKGVPYAKAPVGELRFRPPVPIGKFYKPVVDCLVDRSACMQQMGRFIVGKEEGLFLNVFTPGLPVNGDSTTQFPVMVWIHGGGFYSGSGGSFVYNPLHMVQEGVVVVTMNYRLGPLGFLCLPEAGIEGNAGLKDQLLVFKWVKQNISRFGGDSENITVFGESAGSMSAYLHYLSPNSRKYFHKVICQSGVACSESFFQQDPANKARKHAQMFGYDGNDDTKVLDTLRKTPAKLLIKHQTEVGTETERRLALQMYFRPVIEDVLTEDSIITEPPEKILKSFDTIRMPLINGCTDGEGILGIWLVRKRLNDFAQDPERLVPQLLGNPPSLNKTEVGKEVRQFYFGNKPIGEKSFDELCDVLSDNIFVTNTNLSAEWIAKYQPNVKQYHYRFCFDGKLGFTKKIFNLSHVKGACHGDDLFYLFQSKMLPKLSDSSDEYRVGRTMVRMWTNFAKYSDPTPDRDDQLLPFKWTTVKNYDRHSEQFDLDSLKIDVTCEMENNPCKDRMDLWRGYFKKYREGYLYDI
ncbi:esterase B1 [Aedes aegypti]|uniref:Carboxylic ester hydrolase n=1 Tax=Aedes aegypti TaxID=7159 RepID=A0A6I8T6B2_AEDAE|nr:esterase B1 [Aedes aegypti]